MPRPAKVQRRRNWAPKVRSGCKTCRQRRKKCDENKPHCHRCIKARYVCDGYDTPEAWLFNASTKQGGGCIPSDVPKNSLAIYGDTELLPTTQHALPDSDLSRTGAGWSHGSTGFLAERSIWVNQNPDRNFVQYFLSMVVPVLSTTKRWHLFWSSVVPQISLLNDAVHHAMIALAATYESNMSGIDRREEIMQRCSVAIQNFTADSTSPNVALIMCRLFSSMAQRNGHWRTAIFHMQNGGKIVKEATRNGQADPAIVQLVAPTFLGAMTEPLVDVRSSNSERISRSQQAYLADLETIRSNYGTLLNFLRSTVWKRTDGWTRSFLIISWSIMTQAICSAIYPNILVFTADDPITPATQVKDDLLEHGSLLSLNELKVESVQLFRELRGFFRCATSFCTDLKQQLRNCVDNFVVLAAEIEPRMTGGTFWHDDPNMVCQIVGHDRKPWAMDCSVPAIGIPTSKVDATNLLSSSRSDMSGEYIQQSDCSQAKREYYLEFVCPYRSGLIPMLMDST